MKRLALLFAAFALVLAACSTEEDLLPADGLESASTGSALAEVVAVDYDVQNEQYTVVGYDEDGDIDLYVGQNKNWEQQRENRDPGQGDFTEVALVDLATNESGNTVVVGNDPAYRIAFRTNAPRCVAKGSYTFYGKPRFGGGRNQSVGDLETCLAVDYDAANDQFTVIGLDESGDIDLYVSGPDGWEQQRENRDPGQGDFSSVTFVDLATNTSGNTLVFGNDPEYTIAFRTTAPRCVFKSSYTFSGKPRFGSGRNDTVGDLEICLAAQYDVLNGTYIVVGEAGGQIDVYVGDGSKDGWTQLQENRDIDNRYSPEQFADFAIGDGDAMYGVAVGNIDDYKIGFRQYAPRGTSINAREFYDKPWFGDGKPEAIQE